MPHGSESKDFERVAAVFYSTLTDGINFHCNVIDKRFRIVWHNRVPGESRTTGQLCYEYYQKRCEPCAKCPVDTVFRSGSACIIERERSERLPNGRLRWAEIRAYPVPGANGDVEFVITIGFDITEKKLDLERQQVQIGALERRLKGVVESAAVSSSVDRKGMPMRLTVRQLSVLKLMAQGLSNSDIAKILSISPHTVKSHVIHLFNKLGVNDRTEAAALALRLKII